MENMITKFQSIFSDIKKEKGRFFLFMILKIDEYTNKWSVAISAPWITQENRRESFKYIAKKITSTLTKEEISSVARLGLFQSDEHLITLITDAIRIERGRPIKLENTKINGYQIHEAHIFESVSPRTTESHE